MQAVSFRLQTVITATSTTSSDEVGPGSVTQAAARDMDHVDHAMRSRGMTAALKALSWSLTSMRTALWAATSARLHSCGG